MSRNAHKLARPHRGELAPVVEIVFVKHENGELLGGGGGGGGLLSYFLAKCGRLLKVGCTRTQVYCTRIQGG